MQIAAAVHIHTPLATLPSRHAAYRKRKREGTPVGKRRSAAELAALEAMPLEHRTAEEKEAVRNHRKELKRKEKKAAASALLCAAPPPTRSSSTMRHDSLLLHTAASSAATLPCLALSLRSPPPATVSSSLLFDEFFPTPPAAAAAAVAPPISSAPATSAAAAAMSSASKLRTTILKRRAAMSVLHPNANRRAEEERGQMKIGVHQPGEAKDEPAADEEEETAWSAAERAYADRLIDVIVREVKRRKGEHCAGITPRKADTIQANVHSWAAAARAQHDCVGTEDEHQHAAHDLCPRKFNPRTFFSKGVVEFAHWKAHKRNNDPNQLIRNRCKSDSNDVFVAWMAERGRFLYVCCHAIESANERRK
jgi:hypothetical protein